MKRVVLFLFLAGCVTGNGREGPGLVSEAVTVCTAENAMYSLWVSRLDDGSVVCLAEDLRDPASSFAGDCIGPDPCDCTAVLEGLAWDFVWPAGELPAAECYPVTDYRFPCGCGTRLTFETEDCESINNGTDGDT